MTAILENITNLEFLLDPCDLEKLTLLSWNILTTQSSFNLGNAFVCYLNGFTV